jgi:hypothetical protein
VRSNPYEGGSDHTVFQAAGVPSVLDWHFTDRYYHTNFDTADKTSPAEMKNVGVAVGTSAWLLASANEPAAREVAALVVESGRSRLALEENLGRRLVAEQPTNREAAAERQQTILAAWRKWYAEAVQSVSRLVVGPVSPRLRRDLDRLAATFQ